MSALIIRYVRQITSRETSHCTGLLIGWPLALACRHHTVQYSALVQWPQPASLQVLRFACSLIDLTSTTHNCYKLVWYNLLVVVCWKWCDTIGSNWLLPGLLCFMTLDIITNYSIVQPFHSPYPPSCPVANANKTNEILDNHSSSGERTSYANRDNLQAKANQSLAYWHLIGVNVPVTLWSALCICYWLCTLACPWGHGLLYYFMSGKMTTRLLLSSTTLLALVL